MEHEYLQALKEQRSGHAHDIGLEMVSIGEGMAVGKLKIEDRMLNPYGAIHGGILFSIADTVGGTAALTRGYYIVTSTGNINYLRGTEHSRMITATATEVKPGRTLSVYEVELTDEQDRLVAKATMTYCSLGKPIDKEKIFKY